MHSRRSLTSIFLVVFDLFISLTYAVNCPVDSDCWKQLAKSPIAPEDYLHPLADGSVRTPRHETYVDINDRTTTYNQIYDTAHTYIHDINEQCHLYNHGIKQKDPQYNVTAPELRQPIKKAAMAKIRSRLDDLGTEFTRLAAQLESLKQDNHTDIPAPIFQPIPERIDATLPAYKPLVHPGPPFHLIDHGDLPENYHSDNHPYTKEARWCGQVMARMFRELDDSYTKVHKVDWCRSDFDKLRAPIRAILKAGAVWQPAWGYATGDVSFLQGFYDALDESVGGPPDQFWAKWRCPYAMIQSVRREYHLEWLKGQNGYGGGVILDGLFGISRRVRRA